MLRCLILVIVMIIATGCKHEASDQGKIQTATIAVKKLAFEGFPLWARTHADTPCPASVDELADLVNSAPGMTDPWNHPFHLLCGPTAPPGVHGLGAYSLGPDGKDGTADDIKSWVDAKN